MIFDILIYAAIVAIFFGMIRYAISGAPVQKVEKPEVDEKAEQQAYNARFGK